MAVFLTVSLIEWIQHPDTAIWTLLLSFIWEMGIGLLLGIVLGEIAVYLINRINLDSSGLYPVMAIGFAVLTYMGVFISLFFSKFSFREKTLISWAGLRGAVPIVLATYPLLADLPHGRLFFNVVFFVVLTSAVIQGTTISPLASRLKLVGQEATAQPSLMELVALGNMY